MRRPRPHHRPERHLRAVPAARAEALGAHADLGRLAETVRDTFALERVTVVVCDPDAPRSGVVAACLGAPGLLGHRVPVPAEPATGLLAAGEAAALGLCAGGRDGRPWAFAQLPIGGTGGVLGAVTVAAHRERPFEPRDLRRIEHLARQGAPEFERRRRVLVPRTAAE